MKWIWVYAQRIAGATWINDVSQQKGHITFYLTHAMWHPMRPTQYKHKPAPDWQSKMEVVLKQFSEDNRKMLFVDIVDVGGGSQWPYMCWMAVHVHQC